MSLALGTDGPEEPRETRDWARGIPATKRERDEKNEGRKHLRMFVGLGIGVIILYFIAMTVFPPVNKDQREWQKKVCNATGLFCKK